MTLNFGSMRISGQHGAPRKRRTQKKHVENVETPILEKNKRQRRIGTITSYPGRIGNMSTQVHLLMDKQTTKLDQLHIWLAIPQFPNKEGDLPKELVDEISARNNVILHWLPVDTKVHKRHEIFKICDDGDLIFIFDDDCIYDNRLVESAVKQHEKYPTAIIVYEKYDKHRYEGRHCLYKEGKTGGPYVNIYRWCGQSMIPASIYPKQALTEENQATRQKCSPVSDECWLTPWLVYKDTPIFYLHFGRTKNISTAAPKASGMCAWTHEVESNGYERRDNWLYATLSNYPKMMEKYKKLFNYGD